MDEMTNQTTAEPVELALQEEKKEATKPFSLRLGEDSMQAFRAWCDEQGMNQADGFAYMVKQLELQQAKDLIPNRQKEVENFQSLLTSMTDAFLHSLELNENAENRIRQSLQQQLESKDQAIADYQKSVSEKNEKIKELKEKSDQADALQSEVNELKKSVENFEKQVADKDSIVVMLTEKLSVAEEKVKTNEEQINKFDEVLSRATLAEDKIKRLEEEKENESVLSEERKKTAVSEAVRKAKDDFQKEKDQLQADILAAEKAAHKREQELQEEIRNLEKELGAQKLNYEKLHNESATKFEKITSNYNVLRAEYTAYKKSHPEEKEVQQQDDPDQLTIDDVTKE